MERPGAVMHDCERCHLQPGSDTALAAGCLCPVLDNGHGHGDPNWLVTRLDCPLHGVEEREEEAWTATSVRSAPPAST